MTAAKEFLAMSRRTHKAGCVELETLDQLIETLEMLEALGLIERGAPLALDVR